MKTTRLFLTIVIIVLISACSKEIPMEVSISAEQIIVEGKTAHVVHTDTASILLVRDSLANNNGLYTVRTSLTMLLDSIFYTDQMEDTLTLKLLSVDGQELASMYPIDSLIADTLISYLQSKIGNRITVNFEGKMSGNDILTIQEGGKTIFTGFSFVYADPKITKRVNEYQELVQTLSAMVEEGRKNRERLKSMQGLVFLMVVQEGFNKVEVLNSKLLGMKERMSPLQYAKFKNAHDLMKSYYKQLK